MSDEIRSKVEAIVESARVAFKTRYIGETTRNNNWECDEWRVSFASLGSTKEQHFEFFTGLGLRDVVRGFKAMSMPGSKCIRGHWQAMKPKAPHMADVLYSLILDLSACEQSFVNWCSEYGYDSDSRKALAIYEACQQNADKLHSIFPRDVIRQLSEALEGY